MGRNENPLPSFAVGVKQSGCPKRHPHATVNVRNFQEEQPPSRTMDKAFQPAPAGRRVHYERRRPEETTLYQLVQEHLENSKARV